MGSNVVHTLTYSRLLGMCKVRSNQTPATIGIVFAGLEFFAIDGQGVTSKRDHHIFTGTRSSTLSWIEVAGCVYGERQEEASILPHLF